MLEVVASLPSGTAASYGEVAALLGSRAARRVGRVLATSGGSVPWWRVVRADGSLAPPLAVRAAPRWREEGTPLITAGRVDLVACRERRRRHGA